MSPARRIVALFLLGGVFIMEGFDINAMALAVPRLEGALGLAPSSFGWVFSALPIGLGAGGALIAPLGDRFGRRPLIVAGCLLVAAATFAAATATTITEFLIWRLLTGVGLGICLPNCSALSAELAPEKLRATLMAVVSAGIPIGLASAGFFAPEIIRLSGWHGMFIVPGAMALFLAVAMMFVLEGGPPEKPKGPVQAKETTASRWPQLALFQSPWAFPFFVFAGMLCLNANALFMLNAWMPTVLPGGGMSLDDAARVSGVIQLAGLAMGVFASMMIDRWRPGLSLFLMFTIMALSFVLIGVTEPDPTRWTLLLMIGVGGGTAAAMVLPGLCAHLFPARLLSTAVGMGVLVARIGAITGPVIGELLISGKFSASTFFAAAAVPTAACALVALVVSKALRVRKEIEAEEAAAAQTGAEVRA